MGGKGLLCIKLPAMIPPFVVDFFGPASETGGTSGLA